MGAEQKFKISIVTPSFNQARFLAECLESVRSQDYKVLEHLVYDPGSTDDSLRIAAAAPGVTLINEPDEGQSDAVSKGMRAARGDIIGWLNSDDAYFDSSVVSAVVARFSRPDAPDIVYGRGCYVDEQGAFIRKAHVNDRPDTLGQRLKKEVGVLQPALFFRRSIVDRIGVLSPNLHFCMDYEYWIRATRAGLNFAFLDRDLARARYYPSNKTMAQRGNSLLEVCATLRKHFGFAHHFWITTLAEYNVEGFDGVLASGHGTRKKHPGRVLEEERRLLRAYNGDFDTLALLRKAAPGTPEHETLAFMRERDVPLERPVSLAGIGEATGQGDLHRLVGERNWRFDGNWLRYQYGKARADLQRLRSSRSDDACVIVGNGPSLAGVDRSLLEGRDLFISNFAFKDQALLRNARVLSVVNYLVAEQGCHELNLLENVTKIYPFFLSYCLCEGADTIFVPSKGVAEFSTDPMRNVSWRSTVTFFHLQIAYWLGYRKAVMIGFDHSYRQNAQAKEGDILVCEGKDDNHFRNDYFAGLRWQAADVDNMEAVYRLAKQAYEADGREIVNCTAGGKLELFRRGDLAVELGGSASTRRSSMATASRNGKGADGYPRVLIVDLTGFSGNAATARIKEAFFGAWPVDRLCIVHPVGESLVFSDRLGASVIKGGADEVLAEAVDFDPQVIYYRAVDRELVHSFAMRLQEELQRPLVLHLMDDWPERLKRTAPASHDDFDRGLRSMIGKASTCLAISSQMSRAFEARYGRSFEPMSNAIEPADYPPHARAGQPGGGFVIRYTGALADDMTFESVCDVARAVEAMPRGLNVRFEIFTRGPWKDQAERQFAAMKSVFVMEQVASEDYVALLQGADALLIAYNFDEKSRAYIGYSLANKLPEYLASGTPVLAYGPPEVATIAYLAQLGCAQVVDRKDADLLQGRIEELVRSRELQARLGEQGRAAALERHDLGRVRERLREVLAQAASAPRQVMLGPFQRKREAGGDETDCVARLFPGAASGGTMIDVGAHHGSSMSYFLDKGWRVYAFEPDAKNRKTLETRLAKRSDASRVKLDARAVSNESRKGVSFYSSGVSTGISGLSAFHPSHNQSGQVDTVTLGEALAGEALDSVEFLKIDTEGHDLFVLRGYPWERCSPAVIECEFEDAKTVPLGYTFHDLARFLVEKGYSIYVSEWHPVIRYGMRHDWKRLVRYPCELSDAKAWGNLLAFRDPVDETALVETVREVMGVKKARSRSRGRSATLVVLGNGPSLKDFDFNRFRRFDAIGMNAAYRYWEQIGWYPRYYICLDKVVGLSHKDHIARLIRERAANGIELFLVRRNLVDELPSDLASLECVLNFDKLMHISDLLAVTPLTTGSHAALFGCLLGYKRMILMGVDGNYVERVSGAEGKGGLVLEMAETPAENPNYFFPAYQLAGDRFNIPNPVPDLHLNSWRAVAPVLGARGVTVWNGGARSSVDAFPRRDFSEIEMEEAAFQTALDKKMNKSDAGGRGLRAIGKDAQWASYTWECTGGRAVARITGRRKRDVLVVLTCRIGALEGRLNSLRVEVDGHGVEHDIYPDLRPGCIVARVSARDGAAYGVTELALVLRDPASGAEDRLAKMLSSSLVAVLPADPSLRESFTVSWIDRILRRLFGAGRGGARGAFPLSHFDGIGYLEGNQDVVAGIVAGSMPSALDHYRSHGCSEHRRYALAVARRPNAGTLADIFDGVAYLETHHDVADAIRAGSVSSALDHYAGVGRGEGRRVFTRFDGAALHGTAVDLARLETARKAKVELDALRTQMESEVRRISGSVEKLQSALEASKSMQALLKRELEKGQAMHKMARSEIDLLRSELAIAQTGGTLYAGERNAERRDDVKSWSQLGQDLWVVEESHSKEGGYFVDIGASDGILLNNTYLLETRYGWKGICVEPDPSAFKLLTDRRKARCENACLWSTSGEHLEFILAKEYGAIAVTAGRDKHATKRKPYQDSGETIAVTTLSLNDLLERHGAPAQIDYISLDTEGSEYEILSTFDFGRWKVALWTIEHNRSEQRERIRELMRQHGYIYQEVQFEDWYVLS